MTTQHILDSGEVTGTEPTPVLEETLVVADWQLKLYQESNCGKVDTLTERLQNLCAQILSVLNARRGSDGMTPLQP